MSSVEPTISNPLSPVRAPTTPLYHQIQIPYRHHLPARRERERQIRTYMYKPLPLLFRP